MTGDDVYRAATGQEPPAAGDRAIPGKYGEKGFLTEDDVSALLKEYWAGDALFPWRIEPESGQQPPGPDVVIGPVPWELPDGRYLGFWFSFGTPHEDPQLAWKPVWRRAAGPVTLDELRDMAKEQQ